MATRDLTLPDIGEGVTEGEMVAWLVKEGDTVEADQPVAEVMTDKATVEVPAPESGVVKQLISKEGDVIPVGQKMMVLELGGNAGAATSEPEEKKETKAEEPPQKEKEAAQQATKSGQSSTKIDPPVADSTVLASPSTRRFARESNVDINQLSGSGLAGRVTRDDVSSQVGGASAPSSTSTNAPATVSFPTRDFTNQADERVPLRGVRKKIAENLQMAKRIIPHFTIMDEADVTALVKLRTQAKAAGEKYGVKVTYLPFVIKALVATLHEYPMFNASIDDDAGEIVYKKNFNIGFAADTPNGLMVPVIKNADQKSILELSAEITDLSSRARAGKLKPDEMKGATITITNIGSIGGTYATPIINHPEVAILGMYKMTKKPVFVADGKFKTADVMNYTVTADHRLIDGAVAANFLKSLFAKLENPAELMISMV
jgi:pyruvate dehydrogenase E2 component (dihydrolipoamide acetyltransferase)